ncbi:unnamed protein product, partial [Polarella glacialis]
AVRLETTQVLRRHVQGLKESNLLISRLGAAGQWEKAIHVLSEISAKRLLPTVVSYNATLAACGRFALEVFDGIAGPDLSAYNSALGACSQGRHWRAALHLLRGVCQASFSPALVTYNAAVAALARAREISGAMALLPEMRQVHLSPDVRSYNLVMGAAGQQLAGAWDWAFHVLAEMRQNRCLPDCDSFKAAASSSSKVRRYDLVLELFEELVSSGVSLDAVACNTALGALERSHRWAEALEMLGGWRHGRWKSSAMPDLTSYNTVISACGKAGRWAQALQLASQLAPDKVTLGTLLAACGPSGHWALALHLLSEASQLRVVPNLICLTSAMAACEKGQQWARALELHRAGPERWQLQPDRAMLGCAVAACERGQHWAGAV